MNEFKAYAEKSIDGWIAKVRFAHNGQANVIKKQGGNPKIFKTREGALEEAMTHLLAYLNGDYQAYDNVDIKDVRRKNAEALFIKKQANS